MKKTHDESIPKYQQIAIEVASKIANGDYAEGARLSGRSFVAGRYNVSPETARRAFCILSDLGIVSAEKGSGMYVRSKENAKRFLNQLSKQRNIEAIKNAVVESVERQRMEMDRLNAYLEELIAATEQYRSMNPLVPFAVHITAQCKHLGKTVQEMQLWQRTGATLVAIKREGKLLPSPGPCATPLEHDILYFVTQEPSDQKIRDFLFE